MRQRMLEEPQNSRLKAEYQSEHTAQVVCRGWYEAYGEPLYRYLRFHLPSPDIAEDLTAEVFLRALKAFDRFDPSAGSPRPWLFRIAQNALRDHQRQENRRRTLPIAAMWDLECDAPSPEERVLWQEEVAQLLSAMASPPGSRSRDHRSLLRQRALDCRSGRDPGPDRHCHAHPALARAGALAEEAGAMSGLPGDLRELDQKLRSVHFRPRPSFEPELLRRLSRGDMPRHFPRARASRHLVAAAALIAVVGTLAFLGTRGPIVSVDRCCFDLDGGGIADDGVVVRARRDSEVYRLRVYEDLDGSGSHTRGDLVRLDRGRTPAIEAGDLDGVITTRRCCVDFDGGGPEDDGLLLMGVPPDRVLMAAIYETAIDGSGARPPMAPALNHTITNTEMSLTFKLALGAAVLGIGFPMARLAAQQVDSAAVDTSRVTTLQTLEVTSSIAPTAGPGIGSGIPARISTVTGEAIDAWEPRLLADALATQAGISLYDDLGSPFKLNLSTRGFSAGPVVGLPPGISVFLDGVRQNEPDAAEVNFDLLPMEHVQRVELLSGSGSLLGPNSLGGAVNLITRRGSGPLDAEVEASGGSYGSYSGEASVAGLTGGAGTTMSPGDTKTRMGGGRQPEPRTSTASSTWAAAARSAASAFRRSAPNREPKRRGRCRRASSRPTGAGTSRSAISRTSTSCRPRYRGTLRWAAAGGRSPPMLAGPGPSGSMSTRPRTTTFARLPKTERWVVISTGGGPRRARMGASPSDSAPTGPRTACISS